MNYMLDTKHIIHTIGSINKLPSHKRVQILNMLVEGMSMRAASRVADVSINTVKKLLIVVLPDPVHPEIKL